MNSQDSLKGAEHDETDSILLQVADITRLDKPRPSTLTFLQGWLRGKEEGNFFLRNREYKTWDDVHKRDFITLEPLDQEEGDFSKWVNPLLLDWYNACWGGRKHVRHPLFSPLFPYSPFPPSRSTLRFNKLTHYVAPSTTAPSTRKAVAYSTTTTPNCAGLASFSARRSQRYSCRCFPSSPSMC